MNTSHETDEVIPAWVAALSNVHNVTKDADGVHGARYATLTAVLDAVKPVLADHDLALQQYTVPGDGKVGVKTRIWHSSGQWIEDIGLLMPAPNDPQKVGGSITYARRYALTTFFSIATEDDDAQAATAALREPQRQAAPRQDPADEVFAALKRHAGTPIADAIKAWAAEEGKGLTANDFRHDEDWMMRVADRLATMLEQGAQ